MHAKIIKSDNPQPLAVYTEAFDVDGLIFAAGQLPTDFKTGIPAEAKKDPNFPFYGSDIKKRTHYIMKNLARTFEAAGSSLDHIVKAQVFLEDLRDFDAFDEVWKEYFKVPPARTTVATTGLLVKDAQIEIDLIGYVPGKLSSELIKSENARPIAHYTEKVHGRRIVIFAAAGNCRPISRPASRTKRRRTRTFRSTAPTSRSARITL